MRRGKKSVYLIYQVTKYWFKSFKIEAKIQRHPKYTNTSAKYKKRFAKSKNQKMMIPNILIRSFEFHKYQIQSFYVIKSKCFRVLHARMHVAQSIVIQLNIERYMVHE